MGDHITIRPAAGKWVVRAGGAVLGESARALELTEGDYPPVIYFPREDLAMAFLEETDTVAACPFKGTAKHYDIHTKSVVIKNAAWTYEAPNKVAAAIKDHIAFYAQKAAVEQL